MRKILPFFILLNTLVFNSNQLKAQNINCTIELPLKVNPSKVLILFDDGINQEFIPYSSSSNKKALIKHVNSKYGMVNILYPNKYGNFDGTRFLIKANKMSYIKFNDTKDTSKNLLSSYNVINGFDVYKCDDFLKMKKYCKQEWENNFYYSKKYDESKTDSNHNLYNLSSLYLAQKELNYIRKHPNKYFYFWYFRVNILNALIKTQAKELYETFNNLFPAEFRISPEGNSVKQKLEGNLFVKRGKICPNFSALDYNGNNISLQNLKGKYILLDFWATWCTPCIEKIPYLQKIRQNYSKDKLEIISVSYDKDSTKFINAINSLKMNWTNLFSNNNLRNLFGDTPIPALYLIDDKGIIQFSSWEDGLGKLDEILSKALVN